MRENLADKLSRRCYASALACLLFASIWGAAQSPDLNLPTPATTNEINARIAPRDLGDARLTNHFYTFNGTQGDLIVTVESSNLDGAVDLFLANGLRPLTQVTLFAGGGALDVTKTVFLRKEETIILRVQARTPNDADGTYKIRLAGTFVPATSVAEVATPVEPTAAVNNSATKPAGRSGHRVNSVGARIDEPEAEAPKTEAKETTAKETEAPPREVAPTPRPPATKKTTAPPRRGRATGRTETARRPAPTPERKPAKAKTPASTETDTARAEPGEPTPVKPEAARTPRPKPVRQTRKKEAAKRTVEPVKESPPAAATESVKTAPAPQIGVTRLVIEVKDGPKVEHEMSSVNRVTVVNQIIVVVLKNGRIERYPLTNVLRMAIEP